MNNKTIDELDKSIAALEQATQIIKDARGLYKNNQVEDLAEYLSDKLSHVGDFCWIVDGIYEIEK